MVEAAQERALRNYRRRLVERGLARFEVLGLARDRALIRSLARRLAQQDASAADIRESVSRSLGRDVPTKGGVWASLRQSPLVGADLDVKRSRVAARRIGL